MESVYANSGLRFEWMQITVFPDGETDWNCTLPSFSYIWGVWGSSQLCLLLGMVVWYLGLGVITNSQLNFYEADDAVVYLLSLANFNIQIAAWDLWGSNSRNWLTNNYYLQKLLYVKC